MFKKIAILVMFAAVIVLACLQLSYIQSSSGMLSAYSTQALEQANAGDMDAARETMQRLDKKWHEEQHMYQALMEHSESDKISVSLQKSVAYAENGDQTEFVAEAAALNFLLEHISEIDSPSFDNIL